MNNELIKKKILNKPLIKRKFADSISNLKTHLLEVLPEDCEEDKENQCQTTNNVYSSQKYSHLTDQIQIDDQFVNKRKRMRIEETRSDSTLATRFEEPIAPAVKQLTKSCITITRIPREKSVNVVSNEPMDSKRNQPEKNLFKKSDDLDLSMDEPNNRYKKYNLFEAEDDSPFEIIDEPPKHKRVKTRTSLTKKTTETKLSKNQEDKESNESPTKRAVRISRRSTNEKRPKYVFSEDENAEKDIVNMSDTDEEKKPKSIFKFKATTKPRSKASKKPTKKRTILEDDEKLNLSSAQSNQDDAYAISDEDQKPNTKKTAHSVAKKPTKSQLKKEKAQLELDAETERELEAYYKEQQEIKNYKLIVEVVDRDF